MVGHLHAHAQRPLCALVTDQPAATAIQSDSTWIHTPSSRRDASHRGALAQALRARHSSPPHLSMP